jgi:hypothetical protein
LGAANRTESSMIWQSLMIQNRKEEEIESVKAQGAIVVLVFIGVCILAFSLPVLIAGGRPDTHADIVLMPRHTATATPLDRALTQEAFALLFFTPTTSSLIIPVSGGDTLSASFTPTITITSLAAISGSVSPTLSSTPTSRPLFFATSTAGGGIISSSPTSTRTRTPTPRPTFTSMFTPTRTRTLTPTSTVAATLQPTGTMTLALTATVVVTMTPLPTNPPPPTSTNTLPPPSTYTSIPPTNTPKVTQKPSNTPKPPQLTETAIGVPSSTPVPPQPSDTPVPPPPPTEPPADTPAP